jgi:ABC-type Na+ efflux pump permease subunit
MNLSARRIRGIFRKELRDYRRNVPVIVSMAYLPLIFLIQPIVVIFKVDSSTAQIISHAPVLLYMLAIPALTPGMVAAYAVIGERQQGTLEPVLTTPIRREELLLGKAMAALVPSVAVSYTVFAVFVLVVDIFAAHGIAAALIQGPQLLAQLVFTPLLAAASIWIGIAISTRSNDVRTAQAFSLLATIPLAVPTALMAFKVIPATLGIALGFAAVLVLADGLGWRFVSAMFDRERLITGTR